MGHIPYFKDESQLFNLVTRNKSECSGLFRFKKNTYFFQ